MHAVQGSRQPPTPSARLRSAAARTPAALRIRALGCRRRVEQRGETRQVSSTTSSRVKRGVADDRGVQQLLVRRGHVRRPRAKSRSTVRHRRGGLARACTTSRAPAGSTRTTSWLGSAAVPSSPKPSGGGPWKTMRTSVGPAALAGPDEERDPGHRQLSIQSRSAAMSRSSTRRRPPRLEVPLVLAAHVRVGVGGRHGPQDETFASVERRRARPPAAPWRRGDDLHEVVVHDVAQRADRVVEVAAVRDAEVLGHGDLHATDVVAVPHRLEHRVGEPQVEDLLDPSSRGSGRSGTAATRRVLVQLGGQAGADARSWPNGFSTTTRARSVRPAPERPLTTCRTGRAGSPSRRPGLGAPEGLGDRCRSPGRAKSPRT